MIMPALAQVGAGFGGDMSLTILAITTATVVFFALRTDESQVLIGSVLQYTGIRWLCEFGRALEFERSADAVDGVDDQGRIRFRPVTWPGIYYMMFCVIVSFLSYLWVMHG